MITLKTKQDLILRYYWEGQSFRKISQETGRSRQTVKKYIMQYEAARKKLGQGSDSPELISEIVSPPEYNSSNRKLRLMTPELEQSIIKYLEANEEKRQKGQHKQQMKKIDIHEALLAEGHRVSYSTLCEWLQRIEPSVKEAFVRQRYNPGEITEFDWGHVKLFINGQLRTLSMAVFTSAYSNYRYAVVLPKEDMACFIESHVRYIKHIGGVYRRFVYDNLATAVKRFVGRDERQLTDGFMQLSMYYCFNWRFCNVAKGNEKGHVERSVEFVRRKAFCKKDNFSDLEAVNDHLQEVLTNKLNSRELSGRNVSATSLFEEEKPLLSKAPVPYEYAECDYKSVDKYATISVSTNHYSVPEYLSGKRVFARTYATRILVYDDKQIVASHKRNYGTGQWVIDIRHYLKTLVRKPGALTGSEALYQVQPELRRIYDQYFSTMPRDFVNLLQLMKEEKVTVFEINSAIDKLRRMNTEITSDKVRAVLTSRSAVPLQREPIIKDDPIADYCQRQLQSLSGLIPEKEQINAGGLI